MSATNSIRQLNCELADKLIEEAKQNPSALAGKFVGIANGQVIVVTDDLDEVGRQLEQAEPDARKTCVVEPGLDLNQVHEIWEAR